VATDQKHTEGVGQGRSRRLGRQNIGEKCEGIDARKNLEDNYSFPEYLNNIPVIKNPDKTKKDLHQPSQPWRRHQSFAPSHPTRYSYKYGSELLE
jgi:hypothetical protein